jgi:alpha,alpha-trehalose phosphorylase
LPFAKARALELGHRKGAAYPWRTISGIECSGYFPAGTAQYHINADIAYAFIQYYLFNNDIAFLAEMGAEVIYETARIWLEIGNYHNGMYMINSVTGPDEYTAIVNNNYYTNAMAKYHLHWAEAFYRILSASDNPEIVLKHAQLCERIGLDEREVLEMRDVSEAMLLPFDATHMINPQDDAFLQKPIWPFEDSKYPLLLYYHPLTIYRHQVLKQADTVLAHFLLEAYTTETVIKNSYHYYEALTTHDSSLSACVHGIMASRIGEVDKAFQYFEDSVELDLENTHGNTKDGLHMANIAGTALSVISGFSGFRISDSGISFRPACPKQWQRYQYKIKYRGREIEVTVSDTTIIKLLSGAPFDLKVWDLNYTLDDTLSFSNERRCLL